MEKHRTTPSLFAAACAAFFVSAAPLASYGQVDSEGWNTEVLDFGGLLEEAETFYVSSDASTLDGYYYRAPLVLDGYRFSHYWADFSPYFGGGFTYSNCTDTETPGYMNMSSYAGSGDGDDTYLIAYASSYTPATLARSDGSYFAPQQASFTNATYAALSILQGDGVGKKFGGDDGIDPDWFRLVVRGYSQGLATGDTVVFYLADYRSDDPGEDYVVDDWTTVDLTPLGRVDSLTFELQSSDVGMWGINTPTYFCMDNFVVESSVSTGVQAVGADSSPAGLVSYCDGVLAVKGLSGTDVSVYSLSGMLLATCRVDSDDYACTLGLQPGRYVVRTAQGGCVIQVAR